MDECTSPVDGSKDFDARLNQRIEQIRQIGVAERNSTAVKLNVVSYLPDGREVRLFFARKRGFGREDQTGTPCAVFAPLGGAAKFKNMESAKSLFKQLPRGGINHEDGTEVDSKTGRTRTWENGYLMQEDDDARVEGFNDEKAQAKYEVQIGEVIDFGRTMQKELKEELIDEIPIMNQKASRMFDEVSQPRAWAEPMENLAAEMLQNNFQIEEELSVDRNRDSGRDPEHPQLTHTVVLSQKISIKPETVEALLASGHLNLLDKNTKMVDSPIIAVPIDYLEGVIVPAVKDAVSKNSKIEEVPLGIAFGQYGKVTITTQIADL